MKRGRFTEEQIVAVLREHEAGAKTGVGALFHHPNVLRTKLGSISDRLISSTIERDPSRRSPLTSAGSFCSVARGGESDESFAASR